MDLDRQLRRRLIRSEWHRPRSNGAALDTFERVERQVGAGWVQLDNGETDWFAASWAGLTDLKLHGMSFRPTRLEDELGTTQTGPGEFVRSLNALRWRLSQRDDAPSTGTLSSFQMSGR